jgi:hypothetical protein
METSKNQVMTRPRMAVSRASQVRFVCLFVGFCVGGGVFFFIFFFFFLKSLLSEKFVEK